MTSPSTSENLPGFIAPPLPQGSLSDAVLSANVFAEKLEETEKKVKDAAREHLYLSLSLGSMLHSVYQAVAGRKGLQYTSLFADKPASEATTAAAGGFRFTFTYATGNKYRVLYKDAVDKLRRIGMAGFSADEVETMIAEHSLKLMSGFYDGNPAAVTERLFGAIISANTMRQAMLELAPSEEIDRSMAGLRNALAEQREEALTPEQRREKANAAWASVPKVFSTFLDLHARFMTRTERESAASELRAMASRLLEQPANLLEAR